VEDRVTVGLYLEMTDLPLDAYARDRVPEVLGLPGVDRATWWRNVYRDRPDLPRELPEFDTLAVYECAPSFVAPDTPHGITGHHFGTTWMRQQHGNAAHVVGFREENVGIALVPRDRVKFLAGRYAHSLDSCAFDFAIGESARDAMCLRSCVRVGARPELHQYLSNDESARSRRLRR